MEESKQKLELQDYYLGWHNYGLTALNQAINQLVIDHLADLLETITGPELATAAAIAAKELAAAIYDHGGDLPRLYHPKEHYRNHLYKEAGSMGLEPKEAAAKIDRITHEVSNEKPLAKTWNHICTAADLCKKVDQILEE